MAEVGGTVRFIFDADTSGLENALQVTKGALDELKKHGEKTDVSDILGKQASAAADRTSAAMRNLGSAVAGVAWDTFKTGAAAATAALTTLASRGITDADNLSKFNAQIIGLANSTADANSAMSASVKFFKQNPFQRFETIEATKNLMMYDKSIASSAEGSARLTKALDMLGVASLSTGTPIAELASQWGEISNQSRVNVGQLDEFAMRVPAIWDAIGKKVGKSAGEVREAYKGVGIDGKIVREAMEGMYGLDTTKLNGTKQEVQAYLNTLSGSARQSAEAYLAFSNTLSRQTDRVKGRLADIRQALVGYELTAEGGFKPVEGAIYQSVINLEKTFADLMSSTSEHGKRMSAALLKISQAIAPFIDKIAASMPKILDTIIGGLEKLADNIEFLIPILGGALAMFGGLGANLPVVGPLISGLGNGIKGLAGNFINLFKVNPLLGIFVSLFTVGFVKAYKENEEFRKSISNLFGAIGNLAKALMPAIQNLVKSFADLAGGEASQKVLIAFVNVLTKLINIIAKLPTPVLEGFILTIAGAKSINGIKQSGLAIMGYGKQLLDFKDNIIQTAGAIKNFRPADIGTKIKSTWESVKSSGKAVKTPTTPDIDTSKTKSVGDAISQTGQVGTEMTKAQKGLQTVQKGMATVILAAGAIAAMALALKVAYNSIPNDLGMLAAKLGVMALAIAGISVLGFALGKVGGNVAPGLILMLGIAANIALVGLALGVANKSIPNDVGAIIPKLGVMALAVLGMGALAAAAGALGGLIGVGLLVVAGIAADIALVGLAIGVANKTVPKDIASFQPKLLLMGEVLLAIGVLALGVGALMATGVGALLMGAGLATIVGICAGAIVMAKAVSSINKGVPKDISKVKTKIDSLNKIVLYIASQSYGNIFSNIGKALSVTAISSVVSKYASIARNLNLIQNIQLNPSQIYSKIALLEAVVTTVSVNKAQDLRQSFEKAAAQFSNMVIVAMAGNIVKTYADIADNLMKIQNIQLDVGLIVAKLALLKLVVSTVTSRGALINGALQVASTVLTMATVAMAANIIVNYKKIAENLMKIQSIPLLPQYIFPNLALLKTVIQTITKNGSVINGLLDAAKSYFSEKQATKATEIIKSYVKIAKKVSELSQIQVNASAIMSIAILKNIIQTLTTGGGGIFKGISDLFTGGGVDVEQINTLISVVKRMKALATEIIGIQNTSSAIPSIVALQTNMSALGVSSAQGFQQGFSSQNGSILGTVGGMISNVFGSFTNAGPQMNLVGSQFGQQANSGIGSTNTYLTGQRLGYGAKSGMQQGASGTYGIGQGASNALGNGVQSQKGYVSGRATSVGGAITSAFNSLVNGVGTIGNNIATGLANGLTGAKNFIKKKASEICNTISDHIKKFFGIKSPSRLMMGYGEYIGEGLAIGLADTDKALSKQALIISQNVSDSLQNVHTSNIGDNILNSLTSNQSRIVSQAETIGNSINNALTLSPSITMPTASQFSTRMSSANIEPDERSRSGGFATSTNTPVVQQTNNIYNQIDMEVADRRFGNMLRRVTAK